jgi:16S rRNA (uracil1498-N3)-methyltransferase
MERGDRFVLTDGKHERYQVIIESTAPREVKVLIERPLPMSPPSPVEITIWQSILKARAMSYLVRRTSELGIAAICPFVSERTVVKVQGERSSSKLKHWREIARNSAKQCDRSYPAEIRALSSFKDLFSRSDGEDALKVILWEQEGSKDLKNLLRETSPSRKFLGVVGPEGGFSQEEVSTARQSGFFSVSLGKRILRAETAAITLVAVVQYEWGDLSLSSTPSP